MWTGSLFSSSWLKPQMCFLGKYELAANIQKHLVLIILDYALWSLVIWGLVGFYCINSLEGEFRVLAHTLTSVEPSGPNHNRQWSFKESQSYAALCVFWKRAPVVIKVFCQFIHECQALVWMNELSHTLFQSCACDTLILNTLCGHRNGHILSHVLHLTRGFKPHT